MAVALVGPTASGKSALAHRLALESNGAVEILCVDSMTVYRGMDIGTAKATPAERADVSYHLLDLIAPSEEFSVTQFQNAAREAADQVWNLGGSVVYVGGTGLYGRAVLDNLDIPGQFPEVRAELETRLDDLAGLYAQLVTLDPDSADKMEPTNERRIIRALEVCLGSGQRFSSYGSGLRTYGPARVVQVGLRPDFDDLDRRIDERFRRWMDDGLLDEVSRLAEAGLSRTARQAVGYSQLLRHLDGDLSLEAAVDEAITQSRRLARRQRSWFNRDPRVEWFDDPEAALRRLDDVLRSPDGFVRD